MQRRRENRKNQKEARRNKKWHRTKAK